METNNNRGLMLVGGLLVLAGALFLMVNLGFLAGVGELIWALLFGLGGLAFLAVYASNRRNWWAIIPGFALLGIGTLIGLDQLAPRANDLIGGAIFLGALALAFWIVYLTNRENWWAIIPGGVLTTLALVTIFGSEPNAGPAVGGLFFLGLAATFVLVYLLPGPAQHMTWPLIPAGIMGVMGIGLIAAFGPFINYVWPLVLIAAGGLLLLRALRRNRI